MLLQEKEVLLTRYTGTRSINTCLVMMEDGGVHEGKRNLIDFKTLFARKLSIPIYRNETRVTTFECFMEVWKHISCYIIS